MIYRTLSWYKDKNLHWALPLLSCKGATVSLPCSLCCLHLQMAMITLEQPTSKWPSQLYLGRTHLEPMWEACTLCRRSSWVFPAPGTKKRGLHRETTLPQVSPGISKYNSWGQISDSFNVKKNDANAINMYQNSIPLPHRLVTKSHSWTPHRLFRSGRKRKLCDKNLFTRHMKPLKERLLRC